MSDGSVPYRENSLFRGISGEVLEIQRVASEAVRLPAGEIIFDEGDPPDYCYLVGTGAIRITKRLPDGRQELLSVVMPGDFFGELALYDSSVRSARAVAAVPSEVARIDATMFEKLREAAPLEIAATLADRAIERVRQTNQRLVAGIATAGELSQMGAQVATVSHNLRSPLATIRSSADLLHRWLAADPSTPERTLRFVQIIRDTATSGLAQIDQLMAELRGERGERPAPVPVADILADLRQAVRGFTDRSGLVYNDRVDPSATGAVLLVERGRIVSALVNLVKNAAEALGADGGRIEVSASRNESMVSLAIADSGPGIPPDVVPRLFDAGFTHGKVGGTGLGLAHVRTVVERHGGRISVESEAGRGATFSLHLPLAGSDAGSPTSEADG